MHLLNGFFGWFFFLLLLSVYDCHFNRGMFSMLHLTNKVNSLVIILERECVMKNIEMILKTWAILKLIYLVSEDGF